MLMISSRSPLQWSSIGNKCRARPRAVICPTNQTCAFLLLLTEMMGSWTGWWFYCCCFVLLCMSAALNYPFCTWWLQCRGYEISVRFSLFHSLQRRREKNPNKSFDRRRPTTNLTCPQMATLLLAACCTRGAILESLTELKAV